MASIRSGGKGGLRKVKDTEKRDRSAAAVPGAEPSAPPPPPGPGGAPAGGDAQGGLAGALAAALSQRKKKVSGSGKPSSLCLVIMLTNMCVQTTRKTMMTIGERLLRALRVWRAWESGSLHGRPCTQDVGLFQKRVMSGRVLLCVAISV
jgi:hypothetical protein